MQIGLNYLKKYSFNATFLLRFCAPTNRILLLYLTNHNPEASAICTGCCTKLSHLHIIHVNHVLKHQI